MRYPYWYTMLFFFERRQYVNNGLTLPFLIGAGTILEPKAKLLTVAAFFDQLMEFKIKLTVMKCGAIDEFVFGTLDTETERYHGGYRAIENIACTDGSLDGIESLDQLTMLLKPMYKLLLDQGKFSKNLGLWGPFTEMDKVNIASSIV